MFDLFIQNILFLILLFSVSVLILHKYGLINPYTVIFTAIIYPLLTPVYINILGIKYFSFLNQELQLNQKLTLQAIIFGNLTMFFWFLLLSVKDNFKLKSRIKINVFPINEAKIKTIILSFLIVFFTYLTEPSLKIIGLYSYSEILNDRIKNVNFAGAFLLIFWCYGYLYISSVKLKSSQSQEHTKNFPIFILHFCLIASFVWLLLHSRRSELICMFITYLMMSNRSNINKLKNISLMLFAMFVIERIRNNLFSNSSLYYLIDDSISPLPGGASNVYLTLITSLHYAEVNGYLYGTSLYNYFKELLPSPIYNIGLVEKNKTFAQLILSNYEYNGGTYFGAIFAINFGIWGSAPFALITFYVATFSNYLLKSRSLVLASFGIFISGLAIRAFWYDFLVILKPIIYIFLPIIFLKLIKR